MCCIFGTISKRNQFSKDISEKVKKACYHRGPDEAGEWFSGDKQIFLGHNRLSIIDLSTGSQPIHNEDNSIHIVVNGELYDYQNIRKDLERLGHVFSTHSDSEILVHLYEEYGNNFYEKLRGEFAFIIYDSRKDILIAGRDRFGIKPLFYSYYNERLYLGSEIKCLLAAGIPAYWDEENLISSAYTGFVPMQSGTFFDGISQLPPGHYLEFKGNSFSIHQYWDFNYSTETELAGSDIELIDQFYNLFEESVRLRLKADVPVGVYLSGGIDSSAVLGMTAKIRGKEDTKAFTLSFPEHLYDELSLARETAAMNGAELIPLDITYKNLADNFTGTVRHSESVFVNSQCIAKYLLSRMVNEYGYKVVLTGEGSDEVLAGYSHFVKDSYSEYTGDKPKHSTGLYEDKLWSSYKKKTEIPFLHESIGYEPTYLRSFNALGARSRFLMNKHFRNVKTHDNPYTVMAEDLNRINFHNKLSSANTVNKSLYLWSKHMLPNYILSNVGERMEMAHSIEGRVPFLDHKLVEFAAKLPKDLKIRAGCEKHILRESMRGLLTPSIYKRKKQPFLSPGPRHDKSGVYFNFINSYLRDNLKDLPFFDKKRINWLLKLYPALPIKTKGSLDSLLVILTSLVVMKNEFSIRHK